jgi:hypothetical protein
MAEDETKWIVAKAKTLLDEYDGAMAAPGFATFESVEEFWDNEVRPILPTFKSMSLDFGLGATVDQHSVWHANWQVPNRS